MENTPQDPASLSPQAVGFTSLTVRPFSYPPRIAQYLDHVDLAQDKKDEILTCAWEYTRSVIPHRTNEDRYYAFMRIIVIGTVAEFRGDLIDVEAGDMVLGHDLGALLGELFGKTKTHSEMAREFRSFLLITADKTSGRRSGELFQRYTHALACSPRQWFRLRDADALARFTMAAALACNDSDFWLSEEHTETLSEAAVTMYDAVAFYKHRAEAETNSTFAYIPYQERVPAFERCRELLWALDVACADTPELQTIINFIRAFGGPIHMMMRRYRFVEEGLTIGKPEDSHMIQQARQNVKLWYRAREAHHGGTQDTRRFEELIQRQEELMFPGMAEMLMTGTDGACSRCLRSAHGDLDGGHSFGGTRLCQECELLWRRHIQTLPFRMWRVVNEIRRQC